MDAMLMLSDRHLRELSLSEETPGGELDMCCKETSVSQAVGQCMKYA